MSPESSELQELLEDVFMIQKLTNARSVQSRQFPRSHPRANSLQTRKHRGRLNPSAGPYAIQSGVTTVNVMKEGGK
jgi:hypothetical protein